MGKGKRTKVKLAECLKYLPFSDVSAVLDNYFTKRPVEEVIPLIKRYAVEIPRSSVFITVDGIGGSGKSIIIDAFSAKIAASEKKSIEKIKDSGVGDFSEAIKCFREKGGPACKDPLILANMFAANRRHVIASGTLEQKLNDHDIVISNRYIATTLAYQLAEGNPPYTQLAEGIPPYTILKALAGSYILPDMLIFVYCDPQLANKRKFPRNEDAGRVNFQKAELINSYYKKIASALPNSCEVDTTETGILSKGSPELEAAIKPVVEELYKKYLLLKGNKK